LKNFPSFTLDFVRKRLPSAQGWAYYAWAVENEATALGGGVERTSDGYVKQERKRLEQERDRNG
jgi:hypothetical protein